MLSVSYVICQMHNVDPWDILNLFCFKLISDCLSYVISHMSNAYVDPLDMLNKFYFHVYAQKSLLIEENGNDFFTAPPLPVSVLILELVPS